MKITCTRANASDEINGIPFERQADGSVVATGVSPEAAAVFADFPGYVVEDEKEQVPPTPDAPAAVDVAPAETAPAEAAQATAESKPAKPKK